MSQIEDTSQLRRSLAPNWATALSLFTALVAAGTVTLHLIGDVSHRQYLNHWGIDANLFPKTTDWILINGYYGVVHRFVAILIAILGNLHWLAAAAFILGVYVFILLSPASGVSGEVPAWLLRQPEWRRRLIRQMLLTTLFVTVIPCALFLLTAFMAIPAAFGETSGKATAETEAAEHRKGCHLSKISCVELRKDGEVIGTGFVLDSSPSHIAIFDAQVQRGRVLALDQLEVMSNRAPEAKDGIAP
jgi:hypothetical protein